MIFFVGGAGGLRVVRVVTAPRSQCWRRLGSRGVSIWTASSDAAARQACSMAAARWGYAQAVTGGRPWGPGGIIMSHQ
jgi:hypothetical protein